MKIEEYLKLPYTFKIVQERDGSFYISVEELPGCASVGDTLEEAWENIHEAMEAWIESNIARGLEIPLPEDEDYIARMPPKRKYTVELEIKEVKRGKPKDLSEDNE